MEYKLLQFEPDFYAAHSYLMMAGIAPNNISDTPSEKEYDHQGFEYEYNALTTVCSHAAAMVKRIEKNREDESAKLSLARDYRNAIKCLMTGKQGRRETIDNFTVYMLLTDWKTVTDSVTQSHEENKDAEQEKLIDAQCIPDYGKLLLKAGDIALFDEDDLDKALTEYEVALYNWRTKFANRDNSFSLEIGIKEKVRLYIALYTAIQEDRYIDEELTFLSHEEQEIIKRYRIIQDKNYRHEEIANDIEELVDYIDLSLESFPASNGCYPHPGFESEKYNTIRTIKVIIPKLFQIGYFDEIRLLTDESIEVQNKLKDQAIRQINYLLNTDYSSIVVSILLAKNPWKTLAVTAKVDNDVKILKRQLLIKGKIPDLAYYTSWNTFSYMLPGDKPDANDENVGRLSVMHLSYMNDPMEGSVIEEYLFGKTIQNGRRQAEQPYVFVKCFTQSLDYLPMWKMYGDDAAGCCVIVDWNKTINENAGKRIALYRVCYLNKRGEKYYFSKSDNKDIADVGDGLENLKEDIDSLQVFDGHRIIIETLINPIAYLFKEGSYSYEKEARVLYSFNSFNKRIKKTSQNPPKLFVYTDYRIVIKELILGPKFKDIFLWSPFIKSQLEKMNNIAQLKNSTKMTLSDINYR